MFIKHDFKMRGMDIINNGFIPKKSSNKNQIKHQD